MELVLASNFEDELVDGLGDLPVSTLFGNYPTGLTGGGRPPRVLPPVSRDRFRRHVERIHRTGRRFYATLNTNDLGLREYEPGFLGRFGAEVDQLIADGADGLVVALPLLVEAIRERHPRIPISVSTFARVRTVAQAEFFRAMGADTVVIEEANRDFRLLRALKRNGFRVELLANQTCLRGCPYRAHHLNTSSLAAQTGRSEPTFEYPILECGLEMLRDPSRLISSILVRPEDLVHYERAGVDRFKISGRNKPTAWLLRATRAYAARRYDGNLLDILSFVQVRGPCAALDRMMPDPVAHDVARTYQGTFETLRRLRLENGAFPPDFLARIASADCDYFSCAECGYCASVADRVLSVDGRPWREGRPNVSAPSALPLLAHIGPAAETIPFGSE